MHLFYSLRSALFWDITKRRVVILYRRFGTTYRSHLQGSRSTIFLLGPISCSETSVQNYYSTLCNIAGQRRSYLQHGVTMKSRILYSLLPNYWCRTTFRQGCTNPGRQFARATKFCTVIHNICGSPVWFLLVITLLAFTVLKWLIDF